MDAVVALTIEFDEIEVEYTAYRPDPDVGARWTFDVRKVECLLRMPGKPTIDIGPWIDYQYGESILDALQDLHENGGA